MRLTEVSCGLFLPKLCRFRVPGLTKKGTYPAEPNCLSMHLRLVLLTTFILVINALATQQIAFNAHLGLFSDKHNERLEDLKFIQTDTHPLTHSDVILNSRPMTVYRPRSLETLHNARRQSMRYGESPVEPLEWDVKEVLGPDVENRHTLAQLARMSGNAYALPGLPNWYEVDQAWNQVSIIYLFLLTQLNKSSIRVSHLVGRTRMTVSEDMFFARKITQRLSSLSKVQHSMARPRKRIDSTITCMYILRSSVILVDSLPSMGHLKVILMLLRSHQS